MKPLWLLMALACMGADRSVDERRPPPYSTPRARWLMRADRRLEWYNFGWQVQDLNVGAQGMKNAARDEQRQGELPWLQPKPLSGW